MSTFRSGRFDGPISVTLSVSDARVAEALEGRHFDDALQLARAIIRVRITVDADDVFDLPPAVGQQWVEAWNLGVSRDVIAQRYSVSEAVVTEALEARGVKL